MALDNLANLKAEMRDWALDRPDLVSKFQDCIDMATNDINKVLRTRQQHMETQLVCDENGDATLPPDYLEWRDVTALTNPVTELTPLSPEGESRKYANLYGGWPANFIIKNDTITVLPVTEAPIRLMYWKKIPYLIETPPDDTNWLLQENANVILFGAMKYVEAYKRNQNGVQMFGGMYSAEVDGMVREQHRSQWSRMRARVSGRSTP